ncbi:MAG: DUF192 domain-containing protein [Endomicrobium sp.]|jgi:uncharacterized membrane protein (UPF0127 family)|nr:DUF192 domain-containing protein [Endomicrobium sp.]
MFKKIFLTIFTVCILSLPLFGAPAAIKDGSVITIALDGQRFQLEAANSDKSRVRGLSGREKMPHDGMIFFFDQPQKLVFWMKDMNFPIDIIWVKDDKVIGFEQNAPAQPDTADYLLRKYFSPAESDVVIELNSGDVKKFNIKEGTILKYQEMTK